MNKNNDSELIKQKLKMSKLTFKKAISSLYKERRITIEEDGILSALPAFFQVEGPAEHFIFYHKKQKKSLKIIATQKHVSEIILNKFVEKNGLILLNKNNRNERAGCK